MRRDLKRIIASSKGCCDEIKENAGFDLTPSQFKGLLLLLAQSIRIEAHVPSESHLDRTFLAEVKIGDLFQIILKNIADLRRSQPGIATEHCNASICLDGSTVQRLDDFARTKAGISFSDLDFLVLLPHSSMDEWIKVGRGRLRVSDFIDMIMRNTMEQLLRKNNRDPRLVDFCYQKKSILHHPKFRGTPFMSLFAVGVEKPVRQVEVRFLPSKSDIAASPWSPITFSCTNFGDSLYISPLNEILEAKPKYTDRELNAYFARLHRAGAIPRLYSKLDLPPDLCAFLNQKRWILGLYDAETSTNPFKIIYRINGTAQYQLVTPHVLEFVGTALVSMTETQLISGLHRFAEHHDFDPTETANFISYVQTTLSLLKRAYPGLEDNFERSSQYIAKYQKNMNGNGIKKRRSPAVTHYLHFYIHWADALADIAALGMLGTPITRHILGSMLRVLRIPLKNIDRPLDQLRQIEREILTLRFNSNESDQRFYDRILTKIPGGILNPSKEFFDISDWTDHADLIIRILETRPESVWAVAAGRLDRMMINQGKIDNPELVELFFRRSHGVPHQDRRGWAEALLFAYGWNFNDPNMPHLVKNLCQVNFADSDSLRELVSTFPTIVEADDLIVSFEAKYPGVLVDNECAARKFISLPKAGSILRRDRESKIMSRWRSNTECSHVTEEDITVLTSFYPVPGTLPEQIIDALTEQLARNIPEDSDRILHLMNSNPNFDKATLNLVIGRIKKEQEIPRSLLRRCIKIAHELGSPDMPIVRKAMTIRFVGSDMLPDSEELDICLDTLASSLHSTTDAIAAALKWTESLCKRNQIRPESVLKYLPRLLSKAAQPTFEVEKFGPLLTFWMAVIPDRRARLEFLDRLYTDFIGSTEAFDLSGETHIVVNTDRVMVLATAAVHALNIEPEYAWDYVRIFNKIGILSALVRYSELIASPEGYPRGKDSLSNHLVVLYLEERAWVGVAGLMNALPNCYHPHTVMDSVNVSLLLIRAHAPAVFIDQALNQIVHWTARKAIEIWIWSDTNSRYTYTFQKRLAASRNEKNVVVFGHPDSFESPDFQNRVTEGRSDEPSNPTEIRYATQIVSIEKSALANIAQILSLAACDGLISSTQSGNICLQLISHSIDVIQVLNSEQRSRSAGASAIDPVETASSRFIYTQKIMDMLYFLTALFAIGFNSSIPKSDGTPRGRVGELVIPASRDGRPLTFMYFAMEYAKLILEFPQASASPEYPKAIFGILETLPEESHVQFISTQLALSLVNPVVQEALLKEASLLPDSELKKTAFSMLSLSLRPLIGPG